MSSKLLTTLLVAFAAVGCVAFHATKRIAQLQHDLKPKDGHKLARTRTASRNVKAATSTTYVTLSVYESPSCDGTPVVEETFGTGICFQTAYSSAGTESAMYVWDSDEDELYVEFFTDSSCSESSGYVDYISTFIPPNECFFGVEIETSTSSPSAPSASGVLLDGYASSSSCSSGSNLLLGIWLSNSFSMDDNGFLDDVTDYTCELTPIPFDEYSVNYVNYTVSAYVTKSDTSASSTSSSCFAGSETVQREDGSVVPISSVVVGDRVLAADAHGRAKYSSVIAVPHDVTNSEAARFTHLMAASGKDIKMTPEHLVSVSASCDGTTTLMQAGAVENGMCLVSVDGLDKVIDSKLVRGNGIHTLVTEEEMVVVNGFVASPFAHNHATANAYYNIIRMLPSSVVNCRLMKQANAFFGSLVTTFSR